MSCDHENVREIATRGYSGAVSRDENRAAHGCVCVTEECKGCGSRRSVNVNQWHREEGPWGPTREERRLKAAHARRVARGAVAACQVVRVTRGDGMALTLSVDSEGYICASGSLHRDADVDAAVRSQPVWLERAQRARRLVLAAQAAENESQ